MGDLRDPVLPGAAASDYERYLRTDELLALQKSDAEMVHHDEHLFQTVHQASELWLKLACVELAAASAPVDAGPGGGRDPAGARALGRDAGDQQPPRHAGTHGAMGLRDVLIGARARDRI